MLPVVPGYKHENVWTYTGDEIIWESNKKNVTGVANR